MGMRERAEMATCPQEPDLGMDVSALPQAHRCLRSGLVSCRVNEVGVIHCPTIHFLPLPVTGASGILRMGGVGREFRFLSWFPASPIRCLTGAASCPAERSLAKASLVCSPPGLPSAR